MLGEANAHLGAFVGHTDEDELQAFDRAIQLDSAFAPAYVHPIERSAAQGPDAMRRYLKPYLALGPEDSNADGLRLVRAILDSSPIPNLTARLAVVQGNGLFGALLALSHLPDSAEASVAIARYMASKSWPEPPLNDSNLVKRQLARSLLGRGHLHAGYPLSLQGIAPHVTEAALLGVVLNDTAAAALKKRLSGPVGAPLAGAFPWWSATGDTVSLRRAVARAESLARAPASSNPPLGRYVAQSARAYLGLARGDSSEALDMLQRLPQGVCPGCYLDRLTLAQMLVEQHKDQDAWRLLRTKVTSGTTVPIASDAIWILLRGRVAERTGERDRAIRSYAWVAGMWRNADAELQPYVTEAREGVARLTGEKK
jgi:hypothetical protein